MKFIIIEWKNLQRNYLIIYINEQLSSTINYLLDYKCEKFKEAFKIMLGVDKEA